MGEYTKISWADHTFNPWIGCTKVSKGCMNCYAERDMDHRFHKVQWGPRGTRIKTSAKNWAKPLKWNERAKENGRIKLVFCASLADVFEDWPSKQGISSMHEWRKELFELMKATPWLVWLVLTKRPENVNDMVPPSWIYQGEGKWPQNVWVGFSAEDSSNFDFRIESALKIPTPVLWISAEPLLGAISWLSDYLEHGQIHWVIAGGESGPQARPTWASWARLLMHQTFRSKTPFFFKQWGEWLPASEVAEGVLVSEHTYDRNSETWRVGRKKAGRLLNGKEHSEFPAYIEEYEHSLLIGE